MKAGAMTFGWMLAGIFAVAVAGDTGRRVAVVETDFSRMIEASRK
jgi:roadblock/LC7 domain-containing protein